MASHQLPQHHPHNIQVELQVCGGSVSGLCPLGNNTLNLFHTSEASSLPVELDGSSSLPLGWLKVLDLKSGQIYYKKEKRTMSCNGKVPKLDLSLNLSPPRADQQVESPTRSLSPAPPTSPPSSCISSDNTDVNSPETTSMILVGCPRCLMYVMLSEENPKCPKCKSTVLLDFMHENSTKKKRRSN